ncbi:MAG: glycerophosphodiester phosphodiesterase family protein [Alphaproteobacteria bacterium]
MTSPTVLDLPTVVGHRGAAASAPENTLAGFHWAAEIGVSWVEFDVQLSGDGRCIVFHDDKLDRITSGHGAVDNTSYDAIRRLDAGAWFGPEFAGQRVPPLSEVLTLLLELGIRPDIEIKPNDGRDVETAHVALAEATALWPTDRPPPLITSFRHQCLAAAREVAPHWPRGLLTFRYLRDWRARLEALDCQVFVCHHEKLTRRRVAEIVGAGYPIMAFTVNSRRRAANLLTWGVSSIISDAPENLLSLAAGDL